MTPLALLHIWRQRWGILEDVPDGATANVTHDQEDWGMTLVGMGVWSSRVMTSVAMLLGLLLLTTSGVVVFGIAGQVTLGFLVMALALYIRYYRGLLAFLVLGGLALLCGVRYLSWRWQYTLPDGPLYPLGVCLLLVEVLAFIAFGLWLARMAWPLKQEPVGMPAAERDWPYIDVLLVAPRTGITNVSELAATLAAQQWPSGRMRVFLQDGSGDNHLRAMCRSFGFTHVEGDIETSPAGQPLCLTAKLPQGNGEYVLVFDVDAYAELRKDPLLLQHWAAWLRNDLALATLYTPGHPMAPSMEVTVEALQLQPPRGSLALIRRVAWKQQRDSGLDNFVERLEATDYYTALVGHPLRPSTASNPKRGVTWVRIDDFGDGRSVLKRQRLNVFSHVLHVILPWVLGAMVLGVLAIPLTGVMLIQTPFAWFAAYAIPYAAMMFLAWSDALNLHRLDTGSEIREWLLALVLPLIVAARALLVGFRRGFSRVDAHAKARGSFTLYSRLAVGTIALILCILRLVTTTDVVLRSWLGAVAIAITYAIALTLSRWAAGQEARSLRRTFAEQPCSLVNAEGQSITCTTRNFPLQPLQLDFEDDVSDPDPSLQQAPQSENIDSPFTLILGSARPVRISGAAIQTGPGSALLHIAATSQPVYLRATQHARIQLLQRKYWLPGPDLGFTTFQSSEYQ